MVEKAASFSMIPRDPKEKIFLDHQRGVLTELSMSDVSRSRECKKLLLYAPANHSARIHFLVVSEPASGKRFRECRASNVDLKQKKALGGR